MKAKFILFFLIVFSLVSCHLKNQKRYLIELKVLTEEAVKYEVNTGAFTLKKLLDKNGIGYIDNSIDDSLELALKDYDSIKEAKIKEIFSNQFGAWDCRIKNGTLKAILKPQSIDWIKELAISQIIKIMRTRIDLLDLIKPTIGQDPINKEIIKIEFTSKGDLDRTINILTTTAKLEFRLVKAGPTADENTLLKPFNGVIPSDAELIKGDPKRGHSGIYLVDKYASVTGKDFQKVRRSMDEWNNPAVSFQLNPEAAERFGQLTGDNIGRQIAIVLDNKVQSAPNINGRIGDSGLIQGGFTNQSAEDLSLILKAGAFPCSLKILKQRTK